MLRNIVTKNISHESFGDWYNTYGKCPKNFPKAFQDETITDDNGYPTYCRRNTGVYKPFVLAGDVQITNSLFLTMQHYMYINNGYDAVAIDVTNASNKRIINHDEIRNFVETRHVIPIEARDQI